MNKLVGRNGDSGRSGHDFADHVSVDVGQAVVPAGVALGQKPPVYLRAGQVMRLGIDGLGEQRQRTVAAV